jgi:transposase
MDTSAARTEITPSRSQSPVAVKKQRRSIAEKRRIVEETLAEGTSVARVARSHGINANQVFQWRRLYHAGRLGGSPSTTSKAIKLLPVTVEMSPSTATGLAGESSARPLSAGSPGTIHIKLGQAQIRIEGNADPVLLRTVLESLRG